VATASLSWSGCCHYRPPRTWTGEPARAERPGGEAGCIVPSAPCPRNEAAPARSGRRSGCCSRSPPDRETGGRPGPLAAATDVIVGLVLSGCGPMRPSISPGSRAGTSTPMMAAPPVGLDVPTMHRFQALDVLTWDGDPSAPLLLPYASTLSESASWLTICGTHHLHRETDWEPIAERRDVDIVCRPPDSGNYHPTHRLAGVRVGEHNPGRLTASTCPRHPLPQAASVRPRRRPHCRSRRMSQHRSNAPHTRMCFG
jgi:hypothetical protein